jgi:hypothetical protein
MAIKWGKKAGECVALREGKQALPVAKPRDSTARIESEAELPATPLDQHSPVR